MPVAHPCRMTAKAKTEEQEPETPEPEYPQPDTPDTPEIPEDPEEARDAFLAGKIRWGDYVAVANR